jgi:hypothetical protein
MSAGALTGPVSEHEARKAPATRTRRALDVAVLRVMIVLLLNRDDCERVDCIGINRPCAMRTAGGVEKLRHTRATAEP